MRRDMARVEVPRLTAHAVFHALVENQLAEDYAPVVRAMTRLTSEGLSRHDAVHAIAFVLAGHLNDLFGARADATDSLAIYAAAVERLTAASWRSSQG